MLHDGIQLTKSPRRINPSRPPNISTVIRWATHGLVGPGGGRIVLKSMKIGGVRYTSETWINEFLAAMNNESEPTPTPPPSDRAAAAMDELRAEGVCA